MNDTAQLDRDASEQRLRELIAAAIPDPHMQLTVLLAVSTFGLDCERTGIASMRKQMEVLGMKIVAVINA